MKYLLILILALNTTGTLNAQNKVVIVSCKSGDLYIDGTKISPIDADDAKQESLTDGEHYLQVRTSSEKFNVTAKIDQNTKDIIRIGCSPNQEPVAKPALSERKTTLLIDKQLNLGGGLTHEVQQNILALDAGDDILLTCDVLNKKGSARISIYEYSSRTEIYRNEGFNHIDQQRISIKSKGIYIFNVTTAAIFGRDIKLSVARIPSPTGDPNFKTGVRRFYDTTQMEVYNSSCVVHSKTNQLGNKSLVKFSLPAGTKYWVYWIGVGQEAKAKMKAFTTQLANALAATSMNPLFAYGMKLVPDLPMLNAPSTISFRFMDAQNANLFMSNQPCQFYICSYADNISASYSLVTEYHPDLILTFANNSTLLAQEVEIRVAAFIIKTRLEMEN